MELGRDFTENLIEEIKIYDVLYDKTNQRYFNNSYKDKCWQEIGAKLEKNTLECKTKWKRLRETFVRKCKSKSTGSGAEEDTWLYYENMYFLKPFIQPRKTKNNKEYYIEVNLDGSNGEEGILNSETERPSCSQKPSPSKLSKRGINSTLKLIEDDALEIKKKNISNTENENDDPDNLICRTIIVLLKEIPDENKDKVRQELFQFIFAVKEKYGRK